jgi:putative peptide zinc metalloprotease protein
MQTPIPPLRPDLRIAPFVESAGASSGKFLVEAGPHCYTLNAATHRVIAAMQQGPATLGQLHERCSREPGPAPTAEELRRLVWEQLPAPLFADTPEAPRRTPFLVHATILPEAVVAVLSRRLTWLFSRPAAAVVAGVFVVVLALSIPAGIARSEHGAGTQAAVVLAFSLASMMIHELGHAAASARFGCPPGAIGAAIYLLFPVMYTDVTRTWRLAPRQRAAVDLGGVYFQSMVASAAGIWALATGSAFATWLLWMNALTMLHMLNPMYKLDGYWLLTDLSGISNLHARMSATLRGLLARLVGRKPAAPAAGTVQGTVLYLYLVLFIAYFVFVGRALLAAGGTLAGRYPPAARAALDDASRAVLGGDPLRLLAEAGHLAVLSLAPLLTALALLFITVRAYRLFVPPVPSTRATAPLAAAGIPRPTQAGA